MSNNNNNWQFSNFHPYAGQERCSIPPQNPFYLFNPVTGMYLQQYPGQSRYLNPQMYFYGQQQQYQQVQMPQQHLQQYGIAAKEPQMPQTPFNNTFPYASKQPFHRLGMCTPANTMSESHLVQQKAQQQIRQGASGEASSQNSQPLPQQFIDQNCPIPIPISSPHNCQNTQNNGRDRSDLRIIPQSYQNGNEDNQTVVKKEEEQSPNEKEMKVKTGKRQRQDNNITKLGRDPHKKIKVEDAYDNQNNQQSKELDITKMGLTNQNNQQLDKQEKRIKLEEPIQLQCKKETQEEGKDEEEEYVCQDDVNDEKSINSADYEKTPLQHFCEQEEEIRLNQENTNENLRSSERINQSKTTIETKSQNNLIIREKKDSKQKKKQQKKSNSSRFSTILKSNIHTQPGENQVQQEGKNKAMQIFYDSLSEENYKLIQQLKEIKIQNCFKNVINGLVHTVNQKFEKIYIYDNPDEEALNGNILKTLKVIAIDKPSQEDKAIFSQKFNKYFSEKKLNNRSIEQIVKNTLYSSILSDFIDNYSDGWLQQASAFSNKEDNRVFLNFLKLTIQDHRYLNFLQRSHVIHLLNKQVISQ